MPESIECSTVLPASPWKAAQGSVRVNGAPGRSQNARSPVSWLFFAAQQGRYAAQQIIAGLKGDMARPYIPHLDGLLISLGSYAGVGTVGPVWVRQLLARLMKIGAETRYLFNIGGVTLVLARGLLLRHEFVALTRGLPGSKVKNHKGKRHSDAVA